MTEVGQSQNFHDNLQAWELFRSVEVRRLRSRSYLQGQERLVIC